MEKKLQGNQGKSEGEKKVRNGINAEWKKERKGEIEIT